MGSSINTPIRTNIDVAARTYLYEGDEANLAQGTSPKRFEPATEQIKSDASAGLNNSLAKAGAYLTASATDSPPTNSPPTNSPPITHGALEKDKAWLNQNFTNWRFPEPVFKVVNSDLKSNTETYEGYLSTSGRTVSQLKIACSDMKLPWGQIQQFNPKLKNAKDADSLPAQIKIYRNPVEIYSWSGSQDNQISAVLATDRQSALQVAKADVARSQKAIKEFGVEFLYHTNYDVSDPDMQAQFDQLHTTEQGYAPGAWQRYQHYVGAIKNLEQSQAFIAKETGQTDSSQAVKQGKQAAQAFVLQVFGQELAFQQHWAELKTKGNLVDGVVNLWEHDRNRVKNDAANYKAWGEGQTGKVMADVAWWGGGNTDNKIAKDIQNTVLAAGRMAQVKSLSTQGPVIYSEGVKNGVPYQVRQQEGAKPEVYGPGPITGNAVPLPKLPTPPH